MSKICITGCAGLLGNNFSRHLLDKGHEVVGIDDLSGGYRDLVDSRVKLLEYSLLENEVINQIFHNEKFDYVYHFAAYAAVGLSPFIRRFNYMNNVVASANVINECINNDVKKIIFTSSMDVYGSAYSPPFTEDFVPMPEDPYGIAKFAVEQDLKHASRVFGLNYSIVRPHNVFGVYQNIWDKYRNVLGIWIRQTLSGLPLSVYGDGLQVRSFSDVKYYMEPFEKLLMVGDGESYNLGSDSHTTILAAAHRFQAVARLHGHDPQIIHLEPRDEVRDAYCDHTLAKRFLGFKDNTNFEQLVESMLLWAKDQPDRTVRIMSRELDRKVYEYWRS